MYRQHWRLLAINFIACCLMQSRGGARNFMWRWSESWRGSYTFSRFKNSLNLSPYKFQSRREFWPPFEAPWCTRQATLIREQQYYEFLCHLCFCYSRIRLHANFYKFSLDNKKIDPEQNIKRTIWMANFFLSFLFVNSNKKQTVFGIKAFNIRIE